MKHLRILSIDKDYESLTANGDYRLKIKFEITGTDGSDDSQVLFIGQYRPVGSPPETPGTPIFSKHLHIPDGPEPVVIIPTGAEPIPHDAEVTVWGIVDTDYKPYSSY